MRVLEDKSANFIKVKVVTAAAEKQQLCTVQEKLAHTAAVEVAAEVCIDNTHDYTSNCNLLLRISRFQ